MGLSMGGMGSSMDVKLYMLTNRVLSLILPVLAQPSRSQLLSFLLLSLRRPLSHIANAKQSGEHEVDVAGGRVVGGRWGIGGEQRATDGEPWGAAATRS